MSTIKFTIDGAEVEGRADETIWQIAKRYDVDIPHLCYSTAPTYRADGNCRACMVEVEGERVLAASCIRKPTEGMKVKATSDRAKTARQMVFELLVTDQEFEHQLPRRLGALARGLHLHPRCRPPDAGGRQHPLALDLNHAGAAIAVGAVARLWQPAEMRDLDAVALRHLPDRFARLRFDLGTVQ